MGGHPSASSITNGRLPTHILCHNGQSNPITRADRFESLGPQYEWNHNPNNDAWEINNGLVLHTATVTDDFFTVRNTLSHRILGPQSTVTMELDYSGMIDGDRAGLTLFRYQAAWIGVTKTGDTTRLVMVNNVTMEPTADGWATNNKSTEVSNVEISGGTIWLRLNVNISGGDGNEGRFSYSSDGTSHIDFGEPHVQDNQYLGYRYGVFNFATAGLGGFVTVRSFDISQ